MATLLADRVKETSTTTGTGTFSLAGAVSGFQTFVAGIGNLKDCFYAIAHQSANEWEVGIGTVTDASPDTLSRTTVLASSNAGALVSFSAGTKDVFVTRPAALGPITMVKPSDQTGITATTPDTITGLTVPVTANKAYRFHYVLIVNTTSTTEGYAVTVAVPGDATIVFTTKQDDGTNIVFNNFATTQAVNVLATSRGTTKTLVEVWGLLVTAAGAGNLFAQIRAETGSGQSVAVYAKSYGVIHEIV